MMNRAIETRLISERHVPMEREWEVAQLSKDLASDDFPTLLQLRTFIVHRNGLERH